MNGIATLRGIIAALAFAIMGMVAASPALAAPCTTNCLAPGEYDEQIVFGGITRTYKVHVPASYNGSASVPLVLDLHGVTSDSWQQRLISGQLQESDKRGFIVAWPQGVGRSWNAYDCCALAQISNIDDVGFLRTLVTTIKQRANVNDSRVYITGLSNGAAMTHRMVCEAADVFRAAAPVSFPLNRDVGTCNPSRPIPVVEFHGTADPIVSYWGIGPFKSAAVGRDAWGRVDGCTGGFTATPLPLGSRAEIFNTCRGGVKTGLVTIVGGEHILFPNQSVKIAAYIWDNVFNQ